jgi:hypothetical protein
VNIGSEPELRCDVCGYYCSDCTCSDQRRKERCPDCGRFMALTSEGHNEWSCRLCNQEKGHMATYGKYEVIRNPSSYAVTDMQTHEVVFETADRNKAHREARRLRDYPKPPAATKPGEYELGDVPPAR